MRILSEGQMPVLIKDKSSVLFVHIPKCGGSTFEQAMSERGWRELLSIRGINAKDLGFMNCSPQHMHAELLRAIVRPQRFDHVVTIIREPLSRLKSEYAWQLAQGITSLNSLNWIEHVFAEFRKDPFIYDNHIRPQSEFMLENTTVFKLEENGIELALDKVSPNPKKMSLAKRIFSTTEKKHLKKTEKSSQLHEDFDKKINQITDFYGSDYDVLNYTK